MSDDDDLDPMSIEGLDARLVNVETILPDLFDIPEHKGEAPSTSKCWRGFGF